MKQAETRLFFFSFGLLNKLNNFARAAHFLHFFVVTTRIRRENA